MTAAARLFRSLRANGFGTTALRLRVLAADYLFDLRWGVETCSWSELGGLSIRSDNRARGVAYQPTHVLPLRRLFAALRDSLTPDSVLVDIGSGKGRVLMVASDYGFREARGVEFARELCEIARRNLAKYAARTGTATRFEVVEADAAERQVKPDENIFVMYNPFDSFVLERVLEKLAASLSEKPRRVLIVYFNPRWAEVLDRKGYFKVAEFDFWGYRFAVYSNQRAGP